MMKLQMKHKEEEDQCPRERLKEQEGREEGDEERDKSLSECKTQNFAQKAASVEQLLLSLC